MNIFKKHVESRIIPRTGSQWEYGGQRVEVLCVVFEQGPTRPLGGADTVSLYRYSDNVSIVVVLNDFLQNAKPIEYEVE